MSKSHNISTWAAAVGLVTLTHAVSAAGLNPECAAVFGQPRIASGRIRLLFEDSISRAAGPDAVAAWQACPGYGGGIPEFTQEPSVMRTIRVRTQRSHDGDFCGELIGDTITLFVLARQSDGTVVFCDPRTTLRHELGHVLGLKDAPSTRECATRVMAQAPRGGYDPRRVGADECDAIAARWIAGDLVAGQRQAAADARPGDADMDCPD